MAKDVSFDVVSEFDHQELVNAIDQAKRDINSRFDLKDSGSKLELEGTKSIVITTTDEFRLKNILDILEAKMSKRGLSLKILDPQKLESSLGGNVKQEFLLKKGLTQDLAKKIVADIKATKVKVQAAIQGDQVRVSGKDKDDLQEIIKMLREKQDDYNTALQFTNYR
ncbi:MAG: YajQ family cyclic di-GMP-binding protein [Candidatus Melainabacteria bacterium RIFOXYA12_FULL_32_12]|nr:MAG: YajQ family cyclic di-GMP-binding protein [Candidatus Melainabacteria bacterium RIFOXYA2_FULL_32_9]OGI28325.1 MAG: YajQ family cyclic di-GMP-binding protein [Candidatus Melainabacteria bacterium RIFOXYA12_FULL_32_12]